MRACCLRSGRTDRSLTGYRASEARKLRARAAKRPALHTRARPDAGWRPGTTAHPVGARCHPVGPVMPLHLVTGPANAAKARVVLDAARARSAASPLLVVPTTADVEIYRRELAAEGAVLGVRVERFDGLLRELGFRAGVPGRTLTELQRERVAAAAIASTPLQRLGAAATTPGFAAALVAFAEE